MRDDEPRAQKRSETRRNVYVGSDYAGYCKRVRTDLGTMWEGLGCGRSYRHHSVGIFDTPEEAADAVESWFD